MVTAADGSPAGSRYTYDADGRRVRRNINTQEVWHVYGMEGELLAEYLMKNHPAAPLKEYGYRHGQLLVTAEPAANLALHKPATQISDHAPLTTANKAVDGNTNGALWDGFTSGTNYHVNSWWQVDLQSVQAISTIEVYGRTDCCPEMSSDFYVLVSDNPFTSTDLGETLAQPGVDNYPVPGYANPARVVVNRSGRYIRVQLAGTQYLKLGEVVVRGSGSQGQTQWMVADHLGTPRMVFDQTGSLAGMRRHDYLPFGEELGANVGGRTTAQGYSQPDGVRQKFTSKERDDETGLDYFFARYYSSTQGRFTSADEPLVGIYIGDPQTWNAYAYTSNNPLSRVDPDGQRWAMQIRDGMVHYQWFDHETKDDNGLTAYDRAVGNGGGWSAVDFNESQTYIYQPGEAGKDYQLNPDGTHGWVTPVEGNSSAAMAGVAIAGRAAPGPSKGLLYAILAFFGLATAEQTNFINNLPQPPGLDPNIYSQSKHNKEVIDGLIGTAVDHIEKIRNNPGSRDVPHWKGEIKAALDRAKNVAERLKGKTKEATKEKIRELEKQAN